jgi:hypothetical protein
MMLQQFIPLNNYKLFNSAASGVHRENAAFLQLFSKVPVAFPVPDRCERASSLLMLQI